MGTNYYEIVMLVHRVAMNGCKGKENGMRMYNKLPGIRSILYFAVTVMATAWLMIALNIIFFCVVAYWYIEYNPDYIGGGEVMEELILTDSGYALNSAMEERLRNQNWWAMLLDGEGKVVWSFDKPEEVEDAYSLSDIARMSKWYLRDYPVYLRVWEDYIMVVGQPKHTVWKYNLEFPELWIDTVLKSFVWMVLLDLLWVLGLAFFFVRRWSKSREQARIEWVSGISHDIRTPLSMVMGYSDGLVDSENLTPVERQQMAVVRHQSIVMKELVEDLNLISRLEYSMQPLRVEKVRMAALIREVAAAFLGDAKEEELEVEVEISSQAEQSWVKADRKLLVRALRNLFHNSLQHSKQGEKVEIWLRMWREGKWCCVSFADNDTGYSMEVLRQLQSRKKKRTVANIRGLGIVYKTVLAHGGKIRFENREEGGSFCEMRLRAYELKK